MFIYLASYKVQVHTYTKVLVVLILNIVFEGKLLGIKINLCMYNILFVYVCIHAKKKKRRNSIAFRLDNLD